MYDVYPCIALMMSAPFGSEDAIETRKMQKVVSQRKPEMVQEMDTVIQLIDYSSSYFNYMQAG